MRARILFQARTARSGTLPAVSLSAVAQGATVAAMVVTSGAFVASSKQ
jgi:hypothetical protein